jgi:membrane protease YdiL (CAAX protease family)
MVFAAGMILTGSLVPSILAHFLANLAGTFLRPGTAKAAPG